MRKEGDVYEDHKDKAKFRIRCNRPELRTTDQQPTLIQCPDLFRKLNRNVNTCLILKVDNLIIDIVRNIAIETVNKKSALNIV